MTRLMLRNVNTQSKDNAPIPMTISGHPPRSEDENFDIGSWPGSVWFAFGDTMRQSAAGIFYGGFHTRYKSAKKFRRVLNDAIEVAEGNKYPYPSRYSEANMTVAGRRRTLGKIVFIATSHERDKTTREPCGKVALCFRIGFLTGQFWTPVEDAKKLLALLDDALALAKSLKKAVS